MKTFADLSFSDIENRLRDIIRQMYGNDVNSYPRAWVCEVFPDYAVFELEGKKYRQSYAVDGTDVTLDGDPVEVAEEYVPVATANMSLTDQPIEIFRAGDYGDKGKYTASDLAAMAAAYDPKKHEAPLVIGHPKLDAPAFGWVKSLKADGETLLANFHQVNPAFESAVKAGSFKKRSVAVARDSEGNLQLRHVGFLGATPPEVKGLADVKFSSEKFEEIEFSEEEQVEKNEEVKRTIQQEVRGFFAELFSGKKPTETHQFSEAEINKRVEAATKPLAEKLSTIEKTFADQAKATATAAQTATANDAVNKLKAAGKWLPAFDKMGAPQIFAKLAESSAVITFGEGEQKKEKPAVEVFADFLSGLKEIVPAGEFVDASKAAAKGAKVVKFNAAPGIDVNPASIEFNEAAEKRAAEKKIELGAAMKELRSEGWKPSGAATANAV